MAHAVLPVSLNVALARPTTVAARPAASWAQQSERHRAHMTAGHMESRMIPALATGAAVSRRRGSRALPQPRQHLESGVAVGGLEPGFALECLHGHHRVMANPAVAAAGIEAERGQV